MTEPFSPVTLKMIAEAAGVTHPTVSRALRNDSRNVSESTRKRIKALATSMGYRPDPAMSALIAHRTRIRPHGDHGKLAILSAWPAVANSLPHYFQHQILGIEQCAHKLGYETEIFTVLHDAKAQKQLSSILVARGIQGVIVGPLPAGLSALHLDWKHFYAVSLGFSMLSPQLHFVASNHIQTIETMYEQVKHLGYKKIGFFHAVDAEKRNRHLYLASYLRALVLDGISYDSSPPLLSSEKTPAPMDWIARHGFDAVICGGSFEAGALMWGMSQNGKQIPQDLGIAAFAQAPDENTKISGIAESWKDLGSGCVNLLHSLILSGERGIPEHRNSILIEGVWRNGETLRKMAQQRKSSRQAVMQRDNVSP